MKREVAEKISAAMKEVERAIGALDSAVWEVEDEALHKQMISTISDTIHHFHIHINIPVAQHYPDLHPDIPGSTAYWVGCQWARRPQSASRVSNGVG